MSRAKLSLALCSQKSYILGVYYMYENESRIFHTVIMHMVSGNLEGHCFMCTFIFVYYLRHLVSLSSNLGASYCTLQSISYFAQIDGLKPRGS